MPDLALGAALASAFDAAWPLALGQLLLLPLVAVGAALVLRRSPARAHTVIVAGLAAAVVAPLLTFALDALGLGLVPGPAIELAHAIASASDQPDDPARAAWPFAPALLVIVPWTLVSATLLARLAGGFARGAALSRRATRCDDARANAVLDRLAGPSSRRVTLHLSDRIDSPAIFSWCRAPRVLLPARFVADADTEMLERVLRHETAHLARRDHWWRLLAELAACLVPWHPAIWWLRRRVYETSELACDARALRDETHPERYAETLLRLTPCRVVRLPALSAVRTTAPLDRRIRAILSSRRSRDRTGHACLLATIAGALVASAGTALAQRRPPHADAPGLDAAYARAHPIQAYPLEVDLGLVTPGGTGAGTIHLINVGARTEHVAGRKVSCGCTTVPFEPVTLAPGEHLALDVTVDAPEEPGVERIRTVTFHFDQQEPLEVRVRLRTSGP